LEVPRCNLARYGQRSFSGPSLWNSLPLTVRDSSLTLTQFCTRLKTFLFTRAYRTSPQRLRDSLRFSSTAMDQHQSLSSMSQQTAGSFTGDKVTIAPIQLAHCRLPDWPFQTLKLVFFFKKNIRKQFYQTALGNSYGSKSPKCRLQFQKKNYCVIYCNFRHAFVPYRVTWVPQHTQQGIGKAM